MVGAVGTAKARSPTVDNRVRRTISDDDDAEWRRPRASTSKDQRNLWLSRFDGDVWCRRLNVRTASLYWTASRVFSKRSWWRSTEMESSLDDKNAVTTLYMCAIPPQPNQTYVAHIGRAQQLWMKNHTGDCRYLVETAQRESNSRNSASERRHYQAANDCWLWSTRLPLRRFVPTRTSPHRKRSRSQRSQRDASTDQVAEETGMIQTGLVSRRLRRQCRRCHCDVFVESLTEQLCHKDRNIVYGHFIAQVFANVFGAPYQCFASLYCKCTLCVYIVAVMWKE